MDGDRVLTVVAPTEISSMDDSQESPAAETEGLNMHFSRSSHTGLSALLNAVTLQLSKSDEDKQGDGHSIDGLSPSECDHAKTQKSTTPTIIPESHEAGRDAFPEKLMTLLLDPDNSDIVTFLPDGKYFAIRRHQFSDKLLQKAFQFDNYEPFSEELSKWGFDQVETKRPGIEVYRHRMFREGDWKLCKQMREGESGVEIPEVPSLTLNPSRTSSLSEDELTDRSSEGVKRRLSPTTASKICCRSSPKFRNHCSSDDESSTKTDLRRSPSDDVRSIALSITTETLELRESDDRELPLVQQAVDGATHSIVTDAIEALLRDEDHSRKTFEKHANALSKSSLPGLIPISRQLFSVEENTSSHGGISCAKNESRGGADTKTNGGTSGKLD
jgi:hypothetical protein